MPFINQVSTTLLLFFFLPFSFSISMLSCWWKLILYFENNNNQQKLNEMKSQLQVYLQRAHLIAFSLLVLAQIRLIDLPKGFPQNQKSTLLENSSILSISEIINLINDNHNEHYKLMMMSKVRSRRLVLNGEPLPERIPTGNSMVRMCCLHSFYP